MRRVLAVLTIALLWVGTAAAQDLTGRIEGLVTDESKAVVPAAKVIARHVETNITYEATTGGEGRFVIPKVRLGNYTVTVESPGFRRAVVQNVHVQVGSTADVHVTLQIGEVQQEVTVSADVTQEIVDTTSAGLGAVVDNRQVLELPLNGRNATELVFLQAGTYYETDADGMGNKLFIHGQRHRSINFSLNGIDTQDNLNRASSVMVNQPLLNMTAENVQEFQVATGISSAEFSRGGAQVSAVTRSGGNSFHGSAFWFHRNTVLDANDFFNKLADQDRPPLRRHQFGGRIGGPIVRDKAFFYFGYQQTREFRGIPVHRVVWSQDARQGIFKWVDSNGNVASVNLLECGANVQAILGRDCVDSRFNLASPEVSGNAITLDPFIANNVIANMPMPNIAGGDGLNTLGFRFNADTFLFEHLPSVRLDYRINDKHLFYATWDYTDRNIIGDFINSREPIWPTLGALGERVTHANGFSGALASNFSPTMVNELRIGRVGGENLFGRLQPFNVDWVLDFDDLSDVYSVDGGNRGSYRDNVTLHIRDVFTWVRGRHQFKFGGEWRHRWVDVVSFAELGEFGEIDFNDSDSPPGFSATNLRNMAGASSNPGSVDLNNAEEQLNNLIGFIGQIETRYNVTSISETAYGPAGTPERRIFQNRELDFFFQDNWNLTSNLTLNLGVRWEWAGVPIETNGLILLPEGGGDAVFGNAGPDGFFNPGTLTGKPCPMLSSPIAAPTGAHVDALFDMCSTNMVAGGSNNGNPLFDNDFNNFGPVLGLAWDPFGTGKTSIRAGYRISYMQDVFSIVDGNVDDNAGLVLNHDCATQDGTCGNNVDLLRQVADGNGNIVLSGPSILRPPPTSFTLPTVVHILNTGDTALDFRTFADNLGTAFYQEWSFGIQREFLRNWAVDLRYVGTRGHNLRRVADYNEFNVNAYDPGTDQTFFEAFMIARNNLIACNAVNCSTSFDYNPAVTGSMPNPLMTLLISPESARLLSDTDLQDQLLFGATGEWLDEYMIDRTSEPSPLPGTGNRRRGGAFFGLVLQGRLPLNFFNVNPFVASSRRMVGDGFSTYHAMELEFRRRPVGGFAFQASYTFQRGIADYDGDANELLNDVRPSSVINPRYTSFEFIPRHIFTGNWIYELPIGQGKRWDPENGFARRVFGGWQFGGIVNWRSGRPISFTSGLGMFHRTAISGANTVNLTQGLSIGDLRELTGKLNITATDANTGMPLPGLFWFDPCLSSVASGALTGGTCTADPNAIQGLFGLPNPGELGQLPNSVIFGPRRFVIDFNFSKRTKLSETTELEFRWEMFNAFNNANFILPVTDVFDNDFGRIFRSFRPREMQFALKINF